MSNSSLYGTPPNQDVSSTNSTSLYGGADTPIPTSDGNIVVRGDLIVLSGNILTTATTGNIFPANATTVNIGSAATTVSIGAGSGTTTINNNLVAQSADFGNITIAVADDNTISTTSGALKLSSTTGLVGLVGVDTLYTDTTGQFNLLNAPTTIYAFDSATTLELGDTGGAGTTVVRNSFAVDGTQIGLAPATSILYSENNDRNNRPQVQSTSGNTSGWRVTAPNATTSAVSTISALSSNDNDNGKFISIQARGATTNNLRIQTGKYTAGVLGASGTVVSFVDNVTAYATVNPAGPTNPLDLTTKSYVDAQVDANTTYTINASATIGGANLNLVGSDSTTDTIKFAEGAGVTVTQTDANTITVTSTITQYTDADARASISATGDISYNPTTGVISFTSPTAPVTSVNTQTGAVVLDSDDIAEGTTNLYYTDARARAALSAGTGIAYNSTTGVIDSTITQFTAADARASISATGDISYNSTTGVISYTAAAAPVTSVNSQTGAVVLDSDDIAEGTTNLYYTDARSRAAISGTGDISYNSTTGVISYTGSGGGAVDSVNGQTGVVVLDLDDLDGVTITSAANNDFIQYDSTAGAWVNGAARDGSRIDGELLATRNASFVNPLPNSAEVSGLNGIEAASSPPDAAGPLGYGSAFTATLYYSETAAGANTSPSFNTRTAQGTNAAPTAITQNNVMGSYNFNGYSGTDFAARVATQNGGGGKTVLQPLQMQGYANQNFVESTISLATTIGTQSNVAISSVVSSGSGVFTCSTFDVRAYDVVRVTGTLTGTMTFPGYVSGNLYYVLAGGNATTTFTISAVNDGDPVATGAGTTTGLTFTRCRSILTFAAQTFSPFGPASLVTVAGITPAGFNGSFRAVFGTTTTVGYGNYHTGGSQTVAGTVSIYNVTSGGTGFRVRGFPNSASYNGANRINFIDANATAATYRSDSFTWQGATNTFNYMQLNAAGTTFNTATLALKNLTGTTTYVSFDTVKAQFNKPVAFPVYTAAASAAVTGAVGWQISISDSPTAGGRMAFWDTTNSRWSYISDNTAV